MQIHSCSGLAGELKQPTRSRGRRGDGDNRQRPAADPVRYAYQPRNTTCLAALIRMQDGVAHRSPRPCGGNHERTCREDCSEDSQGGTRVLHTAS